MKNRSHLIALFLILFSHTFAFAQQEVRKQKSNPEAKAKRQTAEMKVRLNLNDEQTSKVYDILLSREKEIVQKKEETRQRNQTHLSKIESLLDEGQKKEFKKLQDEKRERVKAQRHINSVPQKDKGTPKNQ